MRSSGAAPCAPATGSPHLWGWRSACPCRGSSESGEQYRQLGQEREQRLEVEEAAVGELAVDLPPETKRLLRGVLRQQKGDRQSNPFMLPRAVVFIVELVLNLQFEHLIVHLCHLMLGGVFERNRSRDVLVLRLPADQFQGGEVALQEGAVAVADDGGPAGVVGDGESKVGVGFDCEARELECGRRVADWEVAEAELQDQQIEEEYGPH